jgi:hypothetical protein
VNILVVSSLSVLLECFMAVIAVMGYSSSFCILLGGFGSFGMLIGGMVSGNGVWRKFWLGRFMISGSSVKACWCMLHGGWHVAAQFVVQNRCDPIFSIFLMVGEI